MPEYKNQHYVPQFQFRQFSNDGKGIFIYNLKTKQKIWGSIKNQCSEDYFYSKNGKVETIFSELESMTLEILKKIMADHIVYYIKL